VAKGGGCRAAVKLNMGEKGEGEGYLGTESSKARKRKCSA